MRYYAFGIIVILLMSMSMYHISGNSRAAEGQNPLEDVFVNIKQKKNLALLTFTNAGRLGEPIFGVKIKATDDEIRFVKAKGWDRERVNQNTILLKTSDSALTYNRSLIIILITDHPPSWFEWFVFGKNGSQLSFGLLESLTERRPHISAGLGSMSRRDDPILFKHIQGLIDSCSNAYDISLGWGLGSESYFLDKVNKTCNIVIIGDMELGYFSDQCSVPIDKMKNWYWTGIFSVNGISEFCQKPLSKIE